MKLNRRAALAGALALPAIISANASAATTSSLRSVRPGEAIVGVRVLNDRIIDPGRRMSIADYNREFGEDLKGDMSVIRDCHFVGITPAFKFT